MIRKVFFSIVFFVSFLLPAKGEGISFLPPSSADYWKKCFPSTFRNDYVLQGRTLINKEWSQIPTALFREYSINGNRTNFESVYNERRSRLAQLVMAEVMGQEGEFVDEIVKAFHYLKTETWWGIPAHYNAPLPQENNQIVELFSAETSANVAWTLYMLHEQLDSVEPGLYETMRQEVVRRMLIPAVERNFDWKRRTNNWNPWICANWLYCIMLCEDDDKRREKALQQVRHSMDIFYDNYPEDGGCDEGVSYWDRSAASFAECAILMEHLTNGSFSIRNDSKLKEMCSFASKMLISDTKTLNFADATPYSVLHPNIAYLCGRYTSDTTLCRYAAYTAHRFGFTKQPTRLFKSSGGGPSLGRELMFLKYYDDFVHETPAQPSYSEIWLPYLQVFTARSQRRSEKGFYIAAKGGNNNESHNHNDVGNYVIYSNGEPLIVDLGIGTYNAKTFRRERYELMNTRSAYHNVPLINGTEQREGAGYKATDVSFSADTSTARFTLNIAEAYPSAAKVRRWQRTITLRRDSLIEIEEDIDLKKNRGNTELVFVCYGRPDLSDDDRISWHTTKGDVQMHYNHSQLKPAVEKLQLKDQTLLNVWNNNLYRLTFKVIHKKKKQTIRYSFFY